MSTQKTEEKQDNITDRQTTPSKISKVFDALVMEREKARTIELNRVESYNAGYQAAIAQCRDSLPCNNCEQTASARDAVRYAYYELCKELDISGKDIYDAGLSTDDMAARLAARICDIFDVPAKNEAGAPIRKNQDPEMMNLI